MGWVEGARTALVSRVMRAWHEDLLKAQTVEVEHQMAHQVEALVKERLQLADWLTFRQGQAEMRNRRGQSLAAAFRGWRLQAFRTGNMRAVFRASVQRHNEANLSLLLWACLELWYALYRHGRLRHQIGCSARAFWRSRQ